MAGNYSEVMHTFCGSGIDPEDGIIVGGAALAIHGIRHTTDVDIVICEDLFHQVEEDGRTPGGMITHSLMSGLVIRSVQTEHKGRLPVDLLSPEMVNYLEVFQNVDVLRFRGGLNIQIASLKALLAMKESSSRKKDMEDVRLIEERLAKRASAQA